MNQTSLNKNKSNVTTKENFYLNNSKHYRINL